MGKLASAVTRSDCAECSIDRLLLDLLLRREPETLVNHAALGDKPRDVLAQCGSVLETVARAAADEPDVVQRGMPVDQEIAACRPRELSRMQV
jgi:hypothetical protein